MTDPETPTARALLELALSEIWSDIPDGPEDEADSIAETFHGAELLRRADEARVAEGLTVEALVEALVEAVVDALMSDETGDGYYRWQFDNIVRPAILANLPAPRSVVDPLLERWDREIAGHRQVDDVWNRGVADGMAICAADVRHIPAPRPPEPDRTAALVAMKRPAYGNHTHPKEQHPDVWNATIDACIAALAATPEPAPVADGHALTNDCIGGGCSDCETEPPAGIEP